jgi:pimeloyl-ACP methyl ester carboxylesterase
MSYRRLLHCLVRYSAAVLLTALLFPPAPSQAQGTLRERLQERIQSHQAQGGTARETASQTELAGLKVSYWLPPAQAGAAPLVIFSHGFGGCSTQSVFLTQTLAAHGYLVIAPNHRDAACGQRQGRAQPEQGFGNPKDWTPATYTDRRDDIRRLLEALKQSPEWSARIDWQRVVLAGHSLGGYTVLGLAGGWPEWRMPGIKAVLALSPYCAPFADHGDLGHLGVPVMYQTGTRDLGIMPSINRPGGAFEQTASPAYYVSLEGAGHFAWTDLTGSAHEAINASPSGSLRGI